MSDYYAPNGTEIDLRTWSEMFKLPRHVGRTEIVLHGYRITVSTVWLGLDHSFGDGPPIIFEMMMFSGDPRFNETSDRYSTYEEARTAHEYIIERFTAAGGHVITDEQTLIL